MARPKGVAETKPRRTAARKMAAAIGAEGATPAEIMLKVSRHFIAKACDKDGNIVDDDMALKAMTAAKDAAPYYNARLASVEHTGRGGGPIEHADLTKLTAEELDAYEQLNHKLIGATADRAERAGSDRGGEAEAAG